MLSLILSILCGASGLACVVLWRMKAAAEIALKATRTQLDAQESTVREQLVARATAEATLAELRESFDALRDEASHTQRKLQAAETFQAVATEKLAAAEAQKKEFEQLKTQFEHYAKSAALATGNELSNKLLADHQRAREETHKQFEQFTKTASEQLLTKQKELAERMIQMEGKTAESTKQLNILVRSMQNPIGAGAEGEIVLNNLLQQHGFSEGIDYDLQVHLAGEEGNTLRPDGVIYLPHNHAVILDAKASHHIFELFAREEGSPEFEITFQQLRDTMKQHARALASKTYRESMKKLKTRQGQAFDRTTLLMFVPNEEVVSRLHQRDAELGEILRKNEIILVGPVTLSSFLMVAASLVREARQKDESEAILLMSAQLMGDVIAAMTHAEKIIGAIRSSALAFDKFSASINRGLSRMRKMRDKGLVPPKNAAVPSNLPRYEITKTDEVVQGEAEEITTLLTLTNDAA